MDTLGIMHGKSGGGYKIYDRNGKQVNLGGKGIKLTAVGISPDRNNFSMISGFPNLPTMNNYNYYKFGEFSTHKNIVHLLGCGQNGEKHYTLNILSNSPQWIEKNNSPINSYANIVTVSYNNKLHLFYSNLHYVYDEVNDEWDQESNIPFTISGRAKGVVYKENLHIIGHLNGSTNKHYKFTTETSTWSNINTSAVTSSGYNYLGIGISCGVAANSKYIYSGYNGLYCYDDDNGWRYISESANWNAQATALINIFDTIILSGYYGEADGYIYDDQGLVKIRFFDSNTGGIAPISNQSYKYATEVNGNIYIATVTINMQTFDITNTSSVTTYLLQPRLYIRMIN